MSKTITIELPDEIYEVIVAMSAKTGQPVQELALEWMARTAPKPRPKLSPEEAEAARQRLRRHFGAGNSGNPRSADNEQIDADLAKEYGSTHEGEP
jgi:hypothetical protein